jgi:hypothetical protein
MQMQISSIEQHEECDSDYVKNSGNGNFGECSEAYGQRSGIRLGRNVIPILFGELVSIFASLVM